jgi:hypothetical protein
MGMYRRSEHFVGVASNIVLVLCQTEDEFHKTVMFNGEYTGAPNTLVQRSELSVYYRGFRYSFFDR